MRALMAKALVSCGICLASCTTTGTGVGDVGKGGTGAVSFRWYSSDGGISGTMSASLSPARSFSGPFFQITSTTAIDGLGPLWDGWDYGWVDWGPGEGGEFVTHYSGRVLANLADANGERMRCRFHLAQPDSGMSGGGSGACRVPGGEQIDATFPAS